VPVKPFGSIIFTPCLLAMTVTTFQFLICFTPTSFSVFIFSSLCI